MRRPILLFCIMMVVGSVSWARNAQQILPLSSFVYESMDALYLITGNGTPSNARPWTKAEASLIFSRLDSSVLSGSARSLYRIVEETIGEPLRFSFSDGFQFDASADVSGELYAHTNGAQFKTDRDWIRGFEDRIPLLRFNFSFLLKDFLYIFTDLQYGRNRFTERDTFITVGKGTSTHIGSILDEESPYPAMIVGEGDTSWAYSQGFLTNVLWPTRDLDFQTPKRAVASFGGENWNFNLSRDRMKWGNGHSGNFIIGDHVDYQEYSRFTAYSEHFKYDWVNVFFETNPTPNETVAQDTEFRILMAHRLEFRILDIITFALSENIMYRGDVYNFRFLNPAFVYHNLNTTSMFNAIAHAELDIAFAKGFNAYAQYVLDQAGAPNDTSDQADAFGWLAGVEHAMSAGPGVLSTSIEYAQTNPALYRRYTADFLMFRRYATNGVGFVSHIDWIGYQHGPDAQVAQLEFSYRIPKWGSFSIALVGMRHGEIDWHTPNTTVNATRVPSPSGDRITETGVVSFAAEVSIPEAAFSWASVSWWAQLDLVGRQTFVKSSGIRDDKTGDVQFTTGVMCSF